MIVLEYADSYGFEICEARRLTDEEKKEFAEWFREIGMISIGESVMLPHVQFNDPIVDEILSRPKDGEFLGCRNTARIISEEEKIKLIALNDRNKEVEDAAERAKEIDRLREIVRQCETGRLYSEEEAVMATVAWSNINNEGGEGYVPHFWTYAEYDYAKSRLAELEKTK